MASKTMVFGFVFLFISILLLGLSVFAFQNSEFIESFKSKTGHVANYESDVRAVIKRGDVVFLKLFANWCPHCVKMQGDWDKLFSEYNGKVINDKIVHVLEMEEQNENMKEYIEDHGEIEGYPTIVLLRKGESPNDFNGSRDYSGLKSYLLEKLA
tara:strand:+ start:13983 stop:14447 length:465 start_codon:yes stop_codon:yes gene_type:complete